MKTFFKMSLFLAIMHMSASPYKYQCLSSFLSMVNQDVERRKALGECISNKAFSRVECPYSSKVTFTYFSAQGHPQCYEIVKGNITAYHQKMNGYEFFTNKKSVSAISSVDGQAVSTVVPQLIGSPLEALPFVLLLNMAARARSGTN